MTIKGVVVPLCAEVEKNTTLAPPNFAKIQVKASLPLENSRMIFVGRFCTLFDNTKNHVPGRDWYFALAAASDFS